MSLSGYTLLVGREREQEILKGALAQARDGQGSLVLVSGEAGIGKTTLGALTCREAAAAGVVVLTGSCYDLTTTPPYGPWAEVLRDYREGDGLPDLPGQLQPGGGMAGIDTQEALFDLAREFLSSVASVRPLLILLEDLHWADPASLDLLRFLSRSLAGDPVLLIATYRDDEIYRDHPLSSLLPALVREGRVQRVQLHRLDREAVLAIVRERYRLGTDDEARLLDYLDRLAEGNPFFTNELLFSLEGQQLLRPASGGWKLDDLDTAGVPTLVQQVIASRLARLDAGSRHLIDLIAVIDYEVPLDLLSGVHDGSTADLDSSLQQLIDRRLLEIGPGQQSVRFHHALVRQTIYESLPVLHRRELHRRVGDLLAARSRPEPSAVAGHLYEAGDERALGWLLQSAERAQELFAPEAVIAECDRALSLARQLDVEAPLPVYRLRGLARESIGDFEGAREDQETALERARELGDRHAEWQALLDLGMLWASRDYQQTREYCERAVALARTMDDPAALGHSLNRLGNWYTNTDRPIDALRHHQEALEIFQDLEDKTGIASTLDLLGVTYYIAGDMARSMGFYERAISLLRSLGNRLRLGSALATVCGSAGQDFASFAVRNQALPPALGTDIRVLLDEALEIARDTGSRAAESFALSILGGFSSLRGNLRAGLAEHMESLRIAESIEHHQWVALAHERLGAVYLDLFAYDLAGSHLRRALQIATAVRSPFFQQGTTALLGMVCTRSGKLDEAARLLIENTDLDRPPDTLTMRACWLARAELLLAMGQRRAALDTIDELIDSVPPGGICLSPQLLRMRGEILIACGMLDEADDQFQEAYDAAVMIGNRLILWQILARQSRLYLIRGQTGKVDETRIAALEIVDRLADQLDDEGTRAEFLRNARARVPGAPPYAPDRSNTAGLTPRELEVLRAVADGLTDAEAGERLFIATRTVSQHLRSVYNKLGVNNRAAAVRVAMERELI